MDAALSSNGRRALRAVPLRIVPWVAPVAVLTLAFAFGTCQHFTTFGLYVVGALFVAVLISVFRWSYESVTGSLLRSLGVRRVSQSSSSLLRRSSLALRDSHGLLVAGHAARLAMHPADAAPLTPTGIIIIEHRSTFPLPEFAGKLESYRRVRQGAAPLSFYRLMPGE